MGHDLATRQYLLFAQEVKDLCHQVEVNTTFISRASSNRNSVMYHASFILLTQMLCCGWSLSHIPLFEIPWTVARQAPLSMGFSRQEYWSQLPCPSPGDLPDPGIKTSSLTFLALADGFFFFTTSSTWEAQKEWSRQRKTCV